MDHEQQISPQQGRHNILVRKRRILYLPKVCWWYICLMSVISFSCKVSSLVVNLCGPTIWAQWQKWLAPATSSIYYSLTTLRCCQTLGEEYTEIVQVKITLHFWRNRKWKWLSGLQEASDTALQDLKAGSCACSYSWSCNLRFRFKALGEEIERPQIWDFLCSTANPVKLHPPF